MTVHVYVYENTETTLWFESLVVCEGGPWRLIREYDKEIPDPVGPGGTTDYNQLQNRPSINDVLMSGNKTSQQLKIEGSIPPGGTAGQVLTKRSSTDGDADWQAPTGGATSWDQITGKPTDLVQDPNYVHTDNNFTDTEKTKLAGLSNYDDTALSARVTENTTAIANCYTKAQTDEKIADELANFDHLDYEIVTELPTTGTSGVRYLVKHPTDNQFEEYIYVSDAWHDIGSTSDVNLSNYYTKSETNAYVLSQVTPKAEIEINESSNAMEIVGGGRHASFNVNTDGDMEMMLAEPGTYLKTATVPSKTNVDNAISAGVTEAKAYTDNKTLAASGWGVARTGVATVTFNNSRWSSSATVDVSDLGFSSGADYDVVAQPTTGGTATPWGNAVAFVNANKGASSFSVSSVTMEESLSGTVNVKYTIFAKGYGAVAFTGEIPTGGTTGQILTKRSDADGDYGWQNKLNTYVVDKPEGATTVSGSVVQVGDFVNTDGTKYGIYEFYYRTSALPAADATKTYSFSPLLDDYTIFDFIDQSGITSNGHVISSGRTDGTNRIIIQQFSKNNKNVMLRAYGDYTGQTALLRIKFIGTKNA